MFFSMMFYSSIWLIPPISRLILVFQHGNAKQLVFSSQPRKADWRGASYRVWSEEIQEFHGIPRTGLDDSCHSKLGMFPYFEYGAMYPNYCRSYPSNFLLIRVIRGFDDVQFVHVWTCKKTTSEKTCWIQYTIVVELFSLIPISGCPKKWTSHPHSLDQGCRSGSSVFWVTRLGGPVAMAFHWNIGCKIISVVMVYHWSFFLFDYLILSHPLVGEMGDLDLVVGETSAAGCLDAEVMGAPWDFGTEVISQRPQVRW